MNTFRIMIFSLAILALFGCSSEAPPEPEPEPATDEAAVPAETTVDEAPAVVEEEPPAPMVGIHQEVFGTTADGQAIRLFTLSNGTGMSVEIMNYGGIIRSLTAPDRDGNLEDIVLGYDTLAEYEQDDSYMGALIGRYSNRIAQGRFELGGQEYTLSVNDEPNHLHGGDLGFGKVVWEAQPNMKRDGPSLLLMYTSADGEEGYPGKMRVRVRYTLTYKNQLVIEYEARTDTATPVNLTHHNYFNLSGNAKRNILGHHLEIAADHFTPVDSTLIPTGEYLPVEGTPFDFRTAKAVGQDIDSDNQQMTFGGGYDHNWVIDQAGDGQMRYIATLSEPESGRVMVIHSEEPGLQFYSGNLLNGTQRGKDVLHQHRWGLCLETQHFPDSPNQEAFPTTVLHPGEKYETRTAYSFTVE